MGDKLLLKFGTKFQLTSHVKLQNYHDDGNVWHYTSQYNITNQMICPQIVSRMIFVTRKITRL